jgi:glucose-6-phosphate-specific signal transduction histidine kinase
VLGTLVAAFLALFALDAFEGHRGLTEVLPALLVHLAPSLLVLAIVALAWHRSWVGAAMFAALAAGYALAVRRLDWILAISGPLLSVAAAFAWSGWYGREDARRRRP